MWWSSSISNNDLSLCPLYEQMFIFTLWEMERQMSIYSTFNMLSAMCTRKEIYGTETQQEWGERNE